jgi:ketosteroid isomerase-like protein
MTVMSISNKKLVEKVLEMFANNNHDKYLKYLDENIKWNIIGMSVISGKFEFLKTAKFLELENFISSNIKNIIAEGEYVVVESSSNKGQTKNSNKPAYCDIYRLKDGKICELTSYIVDTSSTNEN